MASQYWFSLMLLVSHELLHCASAAVHQHGVHTVERESDGSFHARDADHYDDEARHNVEFDHEAILGDRVLFTSLCLYVMRRERAGRVSQHAVVDKKCNSATVCDVHKSRASGVGADFDCGHILLVHREREGSGRVR